MKPRRLPWKRILLLLVGACLIVIGLLPWMIGDSSAFGKRVADKLELWTGADVALTAPVELHYFPRISISTGLAIRNPKNKALPAEVRCDNARISLSLPHLILGHVVIQSINLVEPEMTYEQAGPTGPQGWHRAEAALVKMLGKRPFDVLRIESGTVRFVSPVSTSRLDSLTLKLDLGDEGERTDGYGSFIWKGEPVRFTYETGLDAEAIRNAASDTPQPLSVDIESAPFTASIDGVSRFDGGFAMEGTMSAAIADLRGFLRWVDLADLDGPGLKDISVAGPFRLNDRTLIFEDGRYAIDGNTATGLLAVAFGGDRPRIEATLAFDTLTLDPYLGPAEETAEEASIETAEGTEPEGETALDHTASTDLPASGDAPADSPAPPVFNWPVLKVADLDLRFSANTIAARDLRLSGGAFTLAAQDGVVLGDIADLEICGGTASARFTLDLTAPTRDVDLSGRLDDVDMAPCLALFAYDVPLQGRANVKGRFKTAGQSWGDFVEQADGDIALDASNGSLPVDLGSLMSDDVPIETVGWATAPATSFGSLNASCRIGAAQVWCQRFSMETPQGPVSGTGRIDIASNSLHWDVALPTVLTSRSDQAPVQTSRQVTIRGPMGEPVISRAPMSDTDSGIPAAAQPITPN